MGLAGTSTAWDVGAVVIQEKCDYSVNLGRGPSNDATNPDH
jgi:hypothetical protein